MPAVTQYSLFDAAEEARCYHDAALPGFFSILVRAKGWRKAHQESYRLVLLPDVLRRLNPQHDSWLSQAEFMHPNRRVVNLLRVGLLFADLDTYREPWAVGKTPEQLAAAVLYHCAQEGIPTPSLLIYSGRGIQAKWLLDDALPRQALPRWNACQRYLVERLAGLGADPQAKDASRVLRLVNTVNSKSGEVCRVVHVEYGPDSQPLRYGFEYLAEALLPVARWTIEQQRQERIERRQQLKLVSGGHAEGLRGFSGRQLAWHRLEDLRTLLELRGGVVEGVRMLFLFWMLNFLLLSGATNSSQMWHEAAALARELDPSWGYASAELSTLYRKAQAFEAGERVEWNGRTYPPLYTPKNDHLIDLFQITDEEQRQLKTIISKDIARERHAAREMARRQANGAMDRETYERQARERQELAKALRAQGLSLRAIAERLGVSVASVHGYVK
jgi:hypothetical protein